jgi:hypothetical protein
VIGDSESKVNAVQQEGVHTNLKVLGTPALAL